jgi:hypothetical protein
MHRSAPWCSIPTTRCSSAFASAWRPSRARSRGRQAEREASPPALLGRAERRQGRHRPAREQRARPAFRRAAAGTRLGNAASGAGGGASELLEAPSVIERRLRARLGELMAAQAVEDEAGRAGLRGGVAGPGLYHRYNAVLKRVAGGKSVRPRRLRAFRSGADARSPGSGVACPCGRTSCRAYAGPASAAGGRGSFRLPPCSTHGAGRVLRQTHGGSTFRLTTPLKKALSRASRSSGVEGALAASSTRPAWASHA